MALPRQQTRTVAGVTYTLTRRRVRNINLRVRADGSVAASAAPRVSVMKVDAFVASKADWVRSAQARVAARREQEAAQQRQGESQNQFQRRALRHVTGHVFLRHVDVLSLMQDGGKITFHCLLWGTPIYSTFFVGFQGVLTGIFASFFPVFFGRKDAIFHG